MTRTRRKPHGLRADRTAPFMHGPVRVVAPAKPPDQIRYAPHALRMEVLKRDGYRCRYCAAEVTNDTANIDHVVPHRRGGQTVPANLVTACQPCNKAKANNVWDARPKPQQGSGVPYARLLRQAHRAGLR